MHFILCLKSSLSEGFGCYHYTWHTKGFLWAMTMIANESSILFFLDVCWHMVVKGVRYCHKDRRTDQQSRIENLETKLTCTWWGCQEHTIGISPLQIVVGKLAIHMPKNEFWPLTYIIQKDKHRLKTTTYDLKLETLKLLEKNGGTDYWYWHR